MASVADADLTPGYQGCLFALDEPVVDATFAELERIQLDERSWVDIARGWLGGADVVFGQLVERLAWRQRQVVMYDRHLPEPRLTSWWDGRDGGTAPLPVLDDARAALSRRYGRPFDSLGFNLYRDGRDSVAWHGDRERFVHADPVVAIVSVGAPRAFHLRPRRRPGDPSRAHERRRFVLGQGDLFVMGGRCQHEWEHAVPKSAHVEGPRLSVMFRHLERVDGDTYLDLGRRRAEVVRD